MKRFKGCVLQGGNLPSARMQSVLSIAGSDPTGGAGILADCQVFQAHGVHGAAVPTALTIQDGLRVKQVLPVFPSALLDQLRVTLAAVSPAAIKIGMLGSDDVVRNVILALAPFRRDIPVVIDPVLASTDGTLLLQPRAYRSLRDLMTGRTLITPNWHEAEILTDLSLDRRRDGEKAAHQLLEELGVEGVLLKGGHIEGNPADFFVTKDAASGEIVSEWMEGERIPGEPVHGTGCALSASIAAQLAQGVALREAIVAARSFVRSGIEGAHTLPNGARLLAFS
ncbi:MAG: bifunctional hydroxymethylpyrimidine kinase/phosphomethylpyrimidine kinase [Myxococcota bacterium]